MRSMAIAILLASCNNDSGGGEPDAGIGARDGQVADPDPDFNDTATGIEVQQRTYEGGGDTAIVANLPIEDPIWPYQVEEPVGACRFSLRSPMSCGFDCEGVCVGDVCQPLPVQQEAGDLTVTDGLATRTLSFG